MARSQGVFLLAGLGTLSMAMLIHGSSTVHANSKPKIDFNRDIRPVLDKCSNCHGPASGAGYGGLRLDSFKTATATLENGDRAIVPGHPEQSELIKRINAHDGTIMPPADSNKTLNPDERVLLAEWIKEGAVYKEHWAFVKPLRPALPTVKDKNWAKNGIDRFVLANLEENALKPEPEAGKTTLIRRVTLDLTGLAPTPQEVKAFLADKSPNAYEKVVDRLLKSPRYGERMAMDWMDYSRYADSNGYQADFERFQSRWRDWVIDAFNKNEPYDQFTIEQLAGDLLPNPTTDQRLATAFSRNHRINTEGGVIPEEWRIETVIDRVETTSAIWLGLTSGCARCHNHKYDPISQREFYQLCAYFNNVPESGSGEERPVSHPPTMKAPTASQEAELATLNSKIATLDRLLQAKLKLHLSEAQAWKVDKPLPVISDGLIARPTFQTGISAAGEVKFEAGRATGAVVTSDKGYLDLGDTANFERNEPFTVGAWVRSDMGTGSAFSRMNNSDFYKGWDLSFDYGKPQAHLISKWTENAIKIEAKQPLANGTWHHITVTYDGSSKAAGMKIYADGKLLDTEVKNDSLTGSTKANVHVTIGRRTNGDIFPGAVDDFFAFNRVLKPEEIATLASTHPAIALLKVPTENRTDAQKLEITRLWSLEHDAEFKTNSEAYAQTKEKRDKLDASIPEVMIMKEMAKPRDCFVLIRGQYDKHGEAVTANVPDFLPKPPPGTPGNRLGLAKWIVSPDNPLTARVTVNRLWERFFGTGIVSTIEDFGTRAEFPSNPELLDYLATEFLRLKWDLKAMAKEIVMSAAYRQSSKITAEKLAKDPLNRLISRGPRFRLPGEVIRDQALYCSGLLVEKLGGPSVRPYMPPGIWDETNKYGNLRNYMHDKGDGLYRRSLYTIWKRTAAPPNMLLFDVPSRETCRVRRARTDTPLQALTLMNDETYTEAARVLAQRMMREGGQTLDQKLSYAFWRVLSRAPGADELKILKTGWQRNLHRYKQDPDAAKVVVHVGDAPLDSKLNQAELAAYTLSAMTLLNLDEAVTKE